MDSVDSQSQPEAGVRVRVQCATRIRGPIDKCGVPIRAILVAKLASCSGLGVLFPQGRNA